jgi:hypothetical protein
VGNSLPTIAKSYDGPQAIRFPVGQNYVEPGDQTVTLEVQILKACAEGIAIYFVFQDMLGMEYPSRKRFKQGFTVSCRCSHCGSAWKSRMIFAFSVQRYNPDHLHDPQQIVSVLAVLSL